MFHVNWQIIQGTEALKVHSNNFINIQFLHCTANSLIFVDSVISRYLQLFVTALHNAEAPKHRLETLVGFRHLSFRLLPYLAPVFLYWHMRRFLKVFLNVALQSA